MPCGSTFPYAAGETLFVTSTTRPTTFPDLQSGRRIFEQDTLRELLYDGTGWVVMSEPVQVTAPGSSSITLGTGGTLTGTSHRQDGYMDFTISLTLGTGGAFTGAIGLIMPTSMAVMVSTTIEVIHAAALYGTFLAVFNAGGPTVLNIQYPTAFTPTLSYVQSGSAPWAWGSGDQIYISGRGRMASRYS